MLLGNVTVEKIMRTIVSVILFLSFTLTAFAQDAKVRASDVLSAISSFLDTQDYRAVLVQGDQNADLYIFTGRYTEPQQVVYAKDIAITGIGGVDAHLTLSPSGALQLISENIAIGRHRWQQTLTIVYRNDQFMVGGYTYSYYDTLAVDDNGDVKTGKCDVNLLTGRGIIDDRPFRTELKALPVQDWSIEISPPECSFE